MLLSPGVFNSQGSLSMDNVKVCFPFFLKAISHSFLTPFVQTLPQQETKEIGSYGMRALITEDQSHFDSEKTQGKDKLSFGLSSCV